MLNSRAITQIFNNALTSGVSNILLITKEGNLLACAREIEQAKTLGAVVATVWNDYEAVVPDNISLGEEIKQMVISGDEGYVVAH